MAVEKFDYDLVVVGSGPHALALVARLLETHPHSLYSDEQHERITRIRNHLNTTKTKFDLNILVLDPSGVWLSQWKTQFAAYGIETLRSPVFFHPDPSDNDALRAFAIRHGRENELKEACCQLFDQSIKAFQSNGKKKKKNMPTKSMFNERERSSYVLPSTRLFNDFCDDLVLRHNMKQIIRQGAVQSITPLMHSSSSFDSLDGFTVDYEELSSKELVSVSSRFVVSCIGMFNIPRVPSWCPTLPHPRIHHSISLLASNSSPLKASQLISSRPRPLLIIGGGLTSAHLSSLATSSARYSSVTLLTRSPLRIKHFDASLPWVGRFRNVLFSQFYSSSLPKRVEMVREARGGGSINSAAYQTLQKLKEQGKLEIMQKAEVVELNDTEDSINVTIMHEGRNMERVFGEIWLATGCHVDVTKERIFRNVMEKYNVDVEGGFPNLTQDLQWSDECPGFFVMGAYATLQLGPNALNLVGARSGAERIASKIMEMIRQTCDESEEEDERKMYERVLGNDVNYFTMLTVS